MSMVRQPASQFAVGVPGSSANTSIPSLSHEELAALHYRRGDMQRASDNYREAARLAPEDYAVQKALADFCYVGLGQPEEALEVYRQLLARRPDDTEVLQIAGNLCASLKQFDEGRAYFARLLSLQPANTLAQAALSALPPLQENQRTEDPFESMLHEARQSFAAGSETGMDRALERLLEHKRKTSGAAEAPIRRETFADIERIIAQGDDEAAVVALERYLQDFPDHAAAHNALGVLCYRRGESERAVEQYRAAVALEPSSLTYRKNLADYLYVVHHDVEAALQQYVEILRLEPGDVETLLALAQVCCETGRRGDARTFLETVLNLEPWNAEARQLIDALDAAPEPAAPDSAGGDPLTSARSAATEGRLQDALQLFKRVLDVDPGNAAAHNEIASVYRQLGRASEAGHHYEESVRCEPGSDVFRRSLADYYAQEAGRYEDALKIYIDLLNAEPRDADTLTSIGRVCELLGRNDDARSFYRNALDVEPWNAIPHDLLRRLEQ